MSFVSLDNKPLRTREQVAREVHAVATRLGLDELATVIALMTISTEVGANDTSGHRQWWCPFNKADPQSERFPHDSESNDGLSSGYFQQQVSRPGSTEKPWGWGGLYGDVNGARRRMTLGESAEMFLKALSPNYVTAEGDPARAGEFAQAVQRSAFGERYRDKWDEAHEVLERALAEPTAGQQKTETPSARPQFIELNLIGERKISTQCEPRCDCEVDLFLLHTSEGAGGEALIQFMEGKGERSYHYIVDNDADGNTVYDLVDTDLAAWSACDANRRSINLAFGHSWAKWSRDEWITNARKAIQIAAWLAVQDCKKYGIPAKVNPPPYERCAGISDHKYCTVALKDGNTHTDVGPNFPWDVFADDVKSFVGDTMAGASAVVTGSPAPARALTADEQHELLLAARKILGMWPSRSVYRDDDHAVDDTIGMLLNIDASTYDILIENQALMGDPVSLAKIRRLADGHGPGARNIDGSPNEWAIDRARIVQARAERLAAVFGWQATDAPAPGPTATTKSREQRTQIPRPAAEAARTTPATKKSK
ncbi:hypothetical protein BayCH28_23225 [Mycolicibacterium sp. CH28]|uniref:N-acetylmuramoyl-L-alanine amidase n=1 Tax=Mycolicibacterium sp. CH28 TaxID=2512237 RepID=UPI001080563E|nr:N-acetylmuramoyl-L-alanine amidase [Mycolicibacterium sp. CH28]TGD84842.1 hypothetical protein BayCH28_23225 [Mycolicibacterium sp. CH28]